MNRAIHLLKKYGTRTATLCTALCVSRSGRGRGTLDDNEVTCRLCLQKMNKQKRKEQYTNAEIYANREN